MSQNIKLLVAGDVGGKFKECWTRVETVNKKNGPFQMLLCVGNFFQDEYVPGLVIPPAPIPTFILGPNKPTQMEYFTNSTGVDIAENVTYLGKSGTYAEASGLKIAYLSGTEAEGSQKSETEFDISDIKNLQIRIQNDSDFNGIDILLTSQWPAEVTSETAAVPEVIKSMSSSPLISQLAVVAKPRYHFCAMQGIHFERAPYRNHRVLAESSQHTTRFISLAAVGNVDKKKWLYAFSITPMKHMDHAELVKSPPDVTECPYSTNILQHQRQRPSQDEQVTKGGQQGGQQFFYDMSVNPQGNNQGQRRKRDEGDRKKPKKPFQPAACWFCLASPEVEKHLVVSIGDSAYLTLAKGGLTDDHVLILPIGHFQSTIECPKEVVEEIQKFKSALKTMFKEQGKGVVFFERNFRSPHLQIQVLPVSLALVPSLKSTCIEFAESRELEFQLMPPSAQLFQMTKVGFPYFFLELPDESKLFIQIGKGFDIQFGRELLASQEILNLPDKVDWRNCKGTKEEETELTVSFRKAFEPVDFTL